MQEQLDMLSEMYVDMYTSAGFYIEVIDCANFEHDMRLHFNRTPGYVLTDFKMEMVIDWQEDVSKSLYQFLRPEPYERHKLECIYKFINTLKANLGGSFVTGYKLYLTYNRYYACVADDYALHMNQKCYLISFQIHD